MQNLIKYVLADIILQTIIFRAKLTGHFIGENIEPLASAKNTKSGQSHAWKSMHAVEVTVLKFSRPYY